MNTIYGVYKITNTITGDFYIGSSKDVKHRFAEHKCPSRWKAYPNNPMYLDMQKYGIDKFEFQVIEEAESEQLKEIEQQFIETLKPTYNNRNANGLDVERQKKRKKEWKKHHKQYGNQLCLYNGETLTLSALYTRFSRAGIPHPTIEAKKYLISE